MPQLPPQLSMGSIAPVNHWDIFGRKAGQTGKVAQRDDP